MDETEKSNKRKFDDVESSESEEANKRVKTDHKFEMSLTLEELERIYSLRVIKSRAPASSDCREYYTLEQFKTSIDRLAYNFSTEINRSRALDGLPHLPEFL